MAQHDYKAFIAQQIRAARARKGNKSQAWLAEMLGVHPTYVSKWERGLVTPGAQTLEQIAEATGVGPLFFSQRVAETAGPRAVPGSTPPGRDSVIRELWPNYEWLLQAVIKDTRLEPAIRDLIEVLDAPVDNPEEDPAQWLLGNIKTFAAVARSHPRRKRKPAAG